MGERGYIERGMKKGGGGGREIGGRGKREEGRVRVGKGSSRGQEKRATATRKFHIYLQWFKDKTQELYTVKVSRDSVDKLVFLTCVTVLPGDVPLKSRHQQVGEEVESQEH